MHFTKGRRILSSLEDWRKYAGPKSSNQWADGRSAKEVAIAWLTGGDGLPPEVASTLREHPRFGPVLEWQAEPEAKLRFDSFAGEPRNSDLAVRARDSFGSYLIAVEAKADESYGESVARTIEAAEKRFRDNPRSNGLARIEQLTKALFGASTAENPELLGLRYQLLTSSAGALCEAERLGYTRTVLLIHEFVTAKTKDTNHSRNAYDLMRFLQALSLGVASELVPGILYGPFTVPGRALLQNGIEFFVGKVVRNLRTGGA